MKSEQLIPADQFCDSYEIETSFIYELQQYGLIEIKTVEQKTLIPSGQIRKLEQLIRLHYDLNINFEGIDVINNLLDKMLEMQKEMMALKNRLRIYEDL